MHTAILRILVLVLLLLPFRAQNALGQIVAMAVVTPKELTAGMARGQTVRGRVRMFAMEKKGTVDCAECHLVVEPGLSGALYIEAWRDQAHRLGQVAKGRHASGVNTYNYKNNGRQDLVAVHQS